MTTSSSRSTLAVFAHFDPGGQVAPHVERYLAELRAAVDRLVVVSTAKLDAEARGTLEGYGDLVERENVGYDFYSWKTGLDHVRGWDRYDRVLICNDSVVGPMRPMAEILGPTAPEDVDFWGMTSSNELSPHVQSWFVVFERDAVGSGLLHGFWAAMQPISSRAEVIRRYEVGLSRLLLTAGLRMGTYLRVRTPSAIRAEMRHRVALQKIPLKDRPPRPTGRATFRDPRWNPTYVLWDRVLDGQLPFVKLDVLRDDPYDIGKEDPLARLEAAYPAKLAGVREYLERTNEEFRRLRGLHGIDPVRGVHVTSHSGGTLAAKDADGDAEDRDGTRDDSARDPADPNGADGRPGDGADDDELAVTR
jgi:rhamnosyltransferase